MDNTTGSHNSFLGSYSGKANTAGRANTFVGANSGLGNVTGNDNVYIGAHAGDKNNGSNNVFLGSLSGQNSVTGNNNVFIGFTAGLSNDSGYYNVLTGFEAGKNIPAKNSNSIYGAIAGYNATGGGNVLIGERAGYAAGSNNVMIGFHAGENASNVNNQLFIDNSNTSNPLIFGDFANDILKLHGKVGIGGNSSVNFGNFPTTAGAVNVSNYNLFVKGGILTEEVRISLQSTWADYVFNKDYNLLSLKDVESFINKNGHLPNVPSAQQVKEEGIALGEMTKIQQEKIEELTLYLIKQNKEIEELKEQVRLLLNKKE